MAKTKAKELELDDKIELTKPAHGADIKEEQDA